VKWEEIELSTPQFFFVRKDFENQTQYENGFNVQDLFITSSVGIVTANDKLFINTNKKELKQNIYNHFSITENNINKKYIKEISYRPFDTQYIYYDPEKLERPREKVMRHFIIGENIGFVFVNRQPLQNKPSYYFLSKNIISNGYIRSDNVSIDTIFPLYLYTGKKRRPNLNPKIINKLEQKLNLSFVPEKEDSLTLTNEGFRDSSFAPGQLVVNSFAPLDLFDYIYAVLHSPSYRETYREFLKIDFPRIPYPADQKAFWKIAALGGKSRRLHLLEGPEFEKIDADAAPAGKILVEKVRFSEGKVFVNDDFCFDDVPQTAWEFYIGGYQPAQKWLKDRKGCRLKAEDLKHYRKIVLALTETARIMGEIDKAGVG
jgi:predicted helicase